MDLQARIEEIQALPWTQIKDLAEALPEPIDKPDELSWKDMAEAIAKAELEAEQPSASEPQETEKPEPAGSIYSGPALARIGIRVGNDGDKVKTDLYGRRIN